MAANPWEPYSQNPEKFDERVKAEKLPDEFLEKRDEFLEKVGSGRILDAGCGSGRDTEYFSNQGFETIGVDIAEGMIDYAKDNKKGEFRKMDIRDLDFGDGEFDGVWESASIFFIPPKRMAQALEEFNRVLKQGGTLFASFKVGEGKITKEIWGEEVVEYHISEEKAITMLKDAGFSIQNSSTNESKDGRNTFANFLCQK